MKRKKMVLATNCSRTMYHIFCYILYQFSQEDSFLKEREGCSPASRWEMNWLRTRDGRKSS
ncbi:hypothetical protein AT276_15505 [Bacillus cereus]|nr:hypothetical protein AT277_00430 [Bacillus cereus]KXY92717.1 hypothetical protein AT276_15505 [Bacillus cereus]